MSQLKKKKGGEVDPFYLILPVTRRKEKKSSFRTGGGGEKLLYSGKVIFLSLSPRGGGKSFLFPMRSYDKSFPRKSIHPNA